MLSLSQRTRAEKGCLPSHWAIYGIGLPEEVLAKIYHKNALEIIPGLKKDLKDILPNVDD